MLLLPFDAHNHVHMGPSWPLSDLIVSDARDASPGTARAPAANLLGRSLCGMAVMSTHPRDFSKVLDLAEKSQQRVIPCVGVHPWFLHELVGNGTLINELCDQDCHHQPAWLTKMEDLLRTYPSMPVGEIGLNGFHFDPITRHLTCPMELQVMALERQLHLAVRYHRPVSLHCVRAMGPMMNTLAKVQKESNGKLPPTMYFHAFGGKSGTATQIIKTFEKKKATRVYFGFAPVINFASPKTLEVIREVGLDRLVLETDHEDAGLVASSMRHGVRVISNAFEISEQELIEKTNQNAFDLYGLS